MSDPHKRHSSRMSEVSGLCGGGWVDCAVQKATVSAGSGAPRVGVEAEKAEWQSLKLDGDWNGDFGSRNAEPKPKNLSFVC